jgi:hypothetical protein
LSGNIRLVWNRLTVTNTLAYYTKELIAAVKSFIVQAPNPAIINQAAGDAELDASVVNFRGLYFLDTKQEPLNAANISTLV